MLALTRLNGHRFFVNGDLIKYSEASPDTVLALVTGEKLVVTESPEEVMHAMLEYRAKVLRTAWPDAAAALSARIAYDVQAIQTPNQRQPKSGDAF
ncbi:MAG TPA: flagellar FlbD family protein [Granulicella sp.]|jgi:flagellar protein FlbD|nr:flagellar FlbD family protein [Granulicella sp.]